MLHRLVDAAIGASVAAGSVASPWMGSASADTVGPRPGSTLPSLDRPVGDVPPPAHAPAGTPAARQHPVPTTTTAVYVVRPGDCLWSIAARHLPGRPTVHAVAAAWPQWYAANRTRIGSDPALLLPGQRLAVPKETR
jgi:nucleoid-associated protein YgaU